MGAGPVHCTVIHYVCQLAGPNESPSTASPRPVGRPSFWGPGLLARTSRLTPAPGIPAIWSYGRRKPPAGKGDSTATAVAQRSAAQLNPLWGHTH